jgi:hypothetical protein
MLRFLPDSWIDGLLRPLLMADSVASLYTEIHAPDWRFMALALLLPLGWLARREREPLQLQQLRLLLGLAACFYVWTFVSGNGRYFLWGLLMVGPLVVLAVRRLPATQSMRNAVILLVLAVQGTSAWMTFEPNVWGLRPWAAGPGLSLDASPLQRRPAVYLTISAISFSILVPKMHPDSRWSNITGQQDLAPGMPEYTRLQELLDSSLPKYVVVHANYLVVGPDDGPMPQARVVVERLISPQGLRLGADRCELIRSTFAALPFTTRHVDTKNQGFLFCPIERRTVAIESREEPPMAPELDAVFEQVERRCPRFFPTGNARTRVMDGAFVRHYSHSDTSLYIDDSGQVGFKNFRALNPTRLGSTERVRRGEFAFDCQRIAGRYLPPWERN